MKDAGGSIARPKNARIACRKCRARKVKCSGGIPCANCQQANCSSECVYPNRSRRIKVQQSYIDDLHDEIQRLRRASDSPAVVERNQARERDQISPTCIAAPQRSASTDASVASISGSREATPQAAAAGDDTTLADQTGDAVRNPLVDERPWFFPLTPEMPILVGEATDVAFATVLRRELLGHTQSHFPRLQNVNDETICSFWDSDCVWPNPARARFLLKVSLNTVCRRYYLVRKSSTLQLLEQAIRGHPECDMISKCKLLALFALGEAYSTRTSKSEHQFPGISYYVNASKMLRVLCEKPRIDCVEIIVMLSIYSLAMNRRHSAYCLVGYAVRFGILMGLHLNVPYQQLPHRELQEHRNRVWWTAYTLDRSWACMLGKPVSIQDDDIDVNLPSTSDWPTAASAADFADTEYLIASLRIANLGGQIAKSIYSRSARSASFSYRVQKALKDLGKWIQELPAPLRGCFDTVAADTAMPIISLYLYFNQCLILASRPVLLYVLSRHRASCTKTTGNADCSISNTAIALSDACIRCARSSYSILTDSWINGSFPTFDYTYTQCLFSVSIILAISSLLGNVDSDADGENFEAATQILEQLDENGNFAAKEFCKHVEAIKTILDRIKLDGKGGSKSQPEFHNHSDAHNDVAHSTVSAAYPVVDASDFALAESSLQDLLDSDLNLSSFEASIMDDSIQAFVWPEGDY